MDIELELISKRIGRRRKEDEMHQQQMMFATTARRKDIGLINVRKNHTDQDKTIV